MNLTRYLRERPSKQLVVGMAAFVAGIAAHSLFLTSSDGPAFFAGLTVIGILLAVFWRHVVPRVVLLAAAAMLIGWLRFDSFITPPPLSEWNGGDRVRIEGTVSAPPQTRESHQRIILDVRSAEGEVVAGRLLLRAPQEPRFAYGDVLRVGCRIERPAVIRGFDEARSLLPSRVFSVCSFPESVARIGDGGHPVARAIYAFADSFITGLHRVLPDPQSSLAAGLLLGSRRLPPEVAADFQAAGMSHIIAVSGYNVATITVILFSVLGLVPLPRRAAIALTLGLLAAFVVATGASASVVRAAIMGSLPFAAQALGRPLRSINALAAAAALMLLTNPALLAFDVGFLLSFAATVGIIALAPRLLEFFGWHEESSTHVVNNIRTSLAQTLSAIILTFPIILASFGRFSVVAPAANLLALFAVPPAMLASFAAGIAGMATPAGALVALPADILLRYLVAVADLFSRIPGANLELGRIHPAIALLLYPAMFIPWAMMRRRSSRPVLVPADVSGWQILDDTHPE